MGKPHAVCMPLPAQGHINAMLKLAKLLHSKGFHITFIHTEAIYSHILTSSGPAALDGSDDFRFETLPNGQTEVDIVSFFISIRDDFAEPFAELVRRLNEPLSGVPPVTCIVSDSFTSFTLGVAAELGIPDVFFCSVSACSYLGMFQFEQLAERRLVPLKGEGDHLDTPIDWIPGMKNMRLKDLPNFLHDEVMYEFFKDEAKAASRATAIIINTFDNLEAPVLDELSTILPPVYTTGPLNLLYRQIPNGSLKTIRSSFYREDPGCLDWLDGRMPGSVLYINFGSVAVFENQQLIEFGWGVANSGHDFLWVIRPDIVYGSSAILPKEFLDEIGGRGFLASWCAQEEVLVHPSVGGFLTHCGWNSTMESIGAAGLPVICYPYFGDQQTNCRYLCAEWGMGLEIENVMRDEIAQHIRELMGGEKGKDMRRKAMTWKESAVKATEQGGSSFLNLERVIKEVLLMDKN